MTQIIRHRYFDTIALRLAASGAEIGYTILGKI